MQLNFNYSPVILKLQTQTGVTTACAQLMMPSKAKQKQTLFKKFQLFQSMQLFFLAVLLEFYFNILGSL